jgi:predicted nucleic acid-binding protein
MILADTSIWVDHFRQADETLQTLLGRDEVILHPVVVGELALGNLRNRAPTPRYLTRLPQSVVAKSTEVFALIEGEKLSGSGIGLVDAHLLA